MYAVRQPHQFCKATGRTSVGHSDAQLSIDVDQLAARVINVCNITNITARLV